MSEIEPARRAAVAPTASGWTHAASRAAVALLLVAVASCTSTPSRGPSGAVTHGTARWIPASWSELPGWKDDAVQQVWPALTRSCQRPAADWTEPCRRAVANPPRSDAQARAWLTQNLQPYRVEARQGGAQGLATGYYEPLVEAHRTAGGAFVVPLHRPPADLAARRPYWTRREIETSPTAQASLRGCEIAYVADPLDALVLQIQGSGRLRLTEPDGSVRMTRVAFAGHNDQPYRSIGRELIDRRELPAGQASWNAIRDWARRNPGRVTELLWSNPRYVFFREEALPDPSLGPRGAQGVPLTPGRSIAVDAGAMPYGTLAWIDTTEPLSGRPLRRLVVAQDTGSAITGAVRIDYFWGWDAGAAEEAARMRQPLRLWVLRPR